MNVCHEGAFPSLRARGQLPSPIIGGGLDSPQSTETQVRKLTIIEHISLRWMA
jgi:hypothetical protein